MTVNHWLVGEKWSRATKVERPDSRCVSSFSLSFYSLMDSFGTDLLRNRKLIIKLWRIVVTIKTGTRCSTQKNEAVAEGIPVASVNRQDSECVCCVCCRSSIIQCIVATIVSLPMPMTVMAFLGILSVSAGTVDKFTPPAKPDGNRGAFNPIQISRASIEMVARAPWIREKPQSRLV